ncbi:MAG: hypothetical protein F6J97_13680 [Leptolyngbya sp. SIO4C1]|nr:hypothetical protein [Leptolyngbya sp. SIO4C1]
MVATADLEALAIETTTFQQILDQTPRLAREIGAIVSLRRQTVDHLQLADRVTSAP